MKDSQEVEQALISKLVNKPKEYYDNHQSLREGLFTNKYNKAIYRWIDAEYQEGRKFDLLKCIQDISKYKGFKDDTAVTYEVMASINDSLGYMHEAETLIRNLTDSFKKSSVKILCQEILLGIDSVDVDDSVTKIELELNQLSTNENGGIVEMIDHLKDAISMIEKNSLSSGLSGVPSGFSNIDKFTGGWQPQDLIIVGGASSMGKTSFALALSFNAAVHEYGSVVFSYEMSTNQLVSRLLSCETMIDNRYLIKGTLTADEWGSIQHAQGRIEKLPLYIDECSDTSLRYLLNRIRQYVITKDVKIVMIDYLQLVSNPMSGRSREQEVSVITRSLKNIAKELDITVIALSQLSRGVERNEGSRPMLSNLRESGEIEQAADVVTFVYRPEYYGHMQDEEGKSTEGKAEIIFAKGRNIGIGSKWLNWTNYLTKFTEELDSNSFY